MKQETMNHFYNKYEGRFFTNGIITFKPTSIFEKKSGEIMVSGCGNISSDNYIVSLDDIEKNFKRA